MSIGKFYENCEIFITGGSGVVGKALIEKILRSCCVRRIYVLLRPKKNFTIDQRLEKLQNEKIFRRLRSTKPDELNKLVAIPGDAVLPRLGITPEYKKMLDNVSIFFHCAATVRFDEPLKVALKLNVGGTLEALTLAETLKNLKVFMHVSTYFSNPYLTYVETKVYESPMDWRLCLKLLENETNEEILDAITKKMITGFPNTYTFTKNLAESLVNDYRSRVPVGIFRPSIVLFGIAEPEPGFPTSFIGAMGLFVLVGAGILKTVYIGNNCKFDITPLDFNSKSMLYYAKKTPEEIKTSNTNIVPVFHCSSSKIFPFTFKDISLLMERRNLWFKNAFEKNFLVPGCYYTPCRFLYILLVFVKQIFPAMLADSLMKLFGHKPVLMSIVRKAYISLEVMQPFMFNNFDSSGITDSENLHRETKGTEFEFEKDIEKVTTFDRLTETEDTMVAKIREILLNEDVKTLPRSKKIIQIKKFIYNVLRAVFAYFCIRWFYRYLLERYSYNDGY